MSVPLVITTLFASLVSAELGLCMYDAAPSSFPGSKGWNGGQICTADDVLLANAKLQAVPLGPGNVELDGNAAKCNTAVFGGTYDPATTLPPDCLYTCNYGDTLKVQLEASFIGNGLTRYDLGVFIGVSGSEAFNGSSCQHYYLYPKPEPGGFNGVGGTLDIIDGYGQWKNFDGDQCGDLLKNEETHLHLQDYDSSDNILMLQCVPQPGSTSDRLEISYCLSWDNNAQGYCAGMEGAIPGTSSKCRCGLFPISIIVPRPPSTNAPTDSPTQSPTASPTKAPTKAPTHAPTLAPTNSPTESPTKAPTESKCEAKHRHRHPKRH